MALTLAQKLVIGESQQLLALNTPGDFLKKLGKLPKGTRLADGKSTVQQIHWFVNNKAQLEKELGRVMKKLEPGLRLWVYFPKGTSVQQTDLTRDKGWDCLEKEAHRLKRVQLLSFDDTWSAFGFRVTEVPQSQKPAAGPKEILNWIDPTKKIVRLPPDLAAALAKNKKEQAFFDQLAFSHRKEYVEWIVNAKKAETRDRRIRETLEKLKEKRKNPNSR